MIRVADYIINKLYEESCQHIFTVTGRGILHLTDALAKHNGIKSISVHHEQAAAYAAMAYSQVNGQLGACLVSTGCAGTNAITGVLCAWQDDIPLIVVSGQNSLHETVRYTGLPIRTYGQQEADIISIVRSITKYAVMIMDPEEIVFELEKAIYLAKMARKGPVWVDVPLDIQNRRIDPNNQKHYIPEIYSVDSAPPKAINDVIEILGKAERPVLLIGSGVRSSGAQDQLHEFVIKSKMPVVYANSATDVVDPQKVFTLGCVGAMAANRAANFAVQNADCLLILGCRLTAMVTGSEMQKFARQAKVIAVDIDPYEHQKHPDKITRFILSDVKDFLQKLSQKTVNSGKIDSWIEKCNHWKWVFPKCEDRYKNHEKVDLYQLAECMTKYLPSESICICDAGLEELIIPTTVEFKGGQRCLHPVSQGAMGYALPAAIGAYFASGKNIVAIIGDGSIMMNLQELETIRYHRLPLKIFVINNNGYSVIRQRQQDLFRTRTIGTDKTNGVSCPDFKKVAACFDIRYELISSTLELEEKLGSILAADDSVICEIMAKDNQQYLHCSARKSTSGEFVRPSIEDQSPFLDRELFLSEMIIEPIDQ